MTGTYPGDSVYNHLKLYSYWRSSAAYRVRIALNLKELPYELVPVNLVSGGGEQRGKTYHDLNPQELVPVLVDGRRVVRQSMAIIEYLEESYDGERTLLPAMKRSRARVRAIAQAVACDIHPLNNLRVLQYLENDLGLPLEEREIWVRHWICHGFRAVEELLSDDPSTGMFCEGDTPGLADLCLVPQVYNAYRFGVDMTAFPTIHRIHRRCEEMEAFQDARPENQPDAPQRK